MAYKYYFKAEVIHEGLNKYRIVKGATKRELKQKVNMLERQWDEEWRKKVEREKNILQKEEIRQKKIQQEEEARQKKILEEEAIEFARTMTDEATERILAVQNILINSIEPIELNPQELKDFSEFNKNKPFKPQLVSFPAEPKKNDKEFSYIPFWAKLIVPIRVKKEEENFKKFQIAYQNWRITCDKIREQNNDNEKAYIKALALWEEEKNNFLEQQSRQNTAIDSMFAGLAKKTEDDINNCVTILMQKTKSVFEKENEYWVKYNADTDSMIVDVLLPSIKDMPKLKSVSYIKSRKEFKDTFLSETVIKKMYESAIYQIVLQTLNYIFSFGKNYSVIDTIFLNGKIKTIDKSTGQNIEPYILSVSCKRSEFDNLNLSAIDSKAWFKASKGVSATSLANVTPITPIVVMDKHDDRFVDAYSVTDTISEGTNLAAMDWQDFENLVREIFEQEFSFNGGEVKITQASRDGGVDAIAFDPDPIRGGKIVIQAKRYTNVVGVSAVRDLYGTVLNEGATKGILVTTSNYGNDAYEFACNKPLTLLNGANLLALIQKHGHKAYININEARDFVKNKR